MLVAKLIALDEAPEPRQPRQGRLRRDTTPLLPPRAPPAQARLRAPQAAERQRCQCLSHFHPPSVPFARQTGAAASAPSPRPHAGRTELLRGPKVPSSSEPGCRVPRGGDAPLPLNVVPGKEGTQATLAHPEGGERRWGKPPHRAPGTRRRCYTSVRPGSRRRPVPAPRSASPSPTRVAP